LRLELDADANVLRSACIVDTTFQLVARVLERGRTYSGIGSSYFRSLKTWMMQSTGSSVGEWRKALIVMLTNL